MVSRQQENRTMDSVLTNDTGPIIVFVQNDGYISLMKMSAGSYFAMCFMLETENQMRSGHCQREHTLLYREWRSGDFLLPP
jgi:hypothetical protein